MKKTLTLLAAMVAVTMFSVAGYSFDNPIEKEIVVSINDAYVPGGFDSESDAFVIVNGLFPNGCYRWKRADVGHKANIHTVKSIASVSQGMCIMVLVPFTQEVQLGKLSSGEHKVRFLNGDGTYMEKTVVVE